MKPLLLSLLLLCSSVSALFAQEDRPPNILFIFIDDMGFADPSCFGNPLMKTPNIDRLAEEGIKLTNFYVNSPICSPSRVAVTTGQYPARWGIHSYLNSYAKNKERGMKDWLDSSAPTTAKKLKANGYATAHFGKWHMGGGRDVKEAPLPTEYGFDETLVAFEGLGDRLLVPGKKGLEAASRQLGRGKITNVQKWERSRIYADRTIDFMRRHQDKPFYIRYFPNDVHDAHVPEPGSEKKWESVTSNPYEQLFFAVLEEMDRQIGRVLDELDTLGLSENTLVVFTSDNGPTDWPRYYKEGVQPPGFTGPYYGRKWSLYEGGIRMPFIARWTGKIPAGVVDETSVMAGIDLSPTFCAAAGVPIPEGETLDGINCLEILKGTPADRPKPLVWQYGEPYANLKPGHEPFISPSLAVRQGDWKLLANANGSNAMLFNLAKDPGETTNLAAQQPERVAGLWQLIRDWAGEMGQEVAEAPQT